MNLVEQIVTDMRGAMKEGKKEELTILRMLVSNLENLKVEKKVSTVNDLTDEDVVKVVQKQVKMLVQELDSLKVAKRDTGKVEKQKEVVETYLPEQLTGEELKVYINGKIEEEKAEVEGSTPKELKGKIMKVLSKDLRGKADMGEVSRLVGELLT